ncbi:MAG: transglycosylase SLT domain-containing protein [Cyanobacteria bacterium Co-bin8]|nr:transglycosylase SLT domain-containing protein [Cyanobacteria bacterium Co-bin8]
MLKLKQLKEKLPLGQINIRKRIPLIAIAGVTALSVGMAVALIRHRPPAGISPDTAAQHSLNPFAERPDVVPQLALLPAEMRALQLAQLANGEPSLVSSRARYLLAVDQINQDRGGSAIPLLTGLEEAYPVLAPYTLLRLGQAQKAAGQPEEAVASWQQVVERYGSDPAAAEALSRLSETDPAYLEQLLQTFPAHPRSIDLAFARLAEDPNRADTLPLLKLIAQYGHYRPEAEAVLDRLSKEFADQLQPADWQMIGFGYWELGRYVKAGPAYAKAPATARNLYRAGRGYQLNGNATAATNYYTLLDQQFPDAPETGLGLVRLSDILSLEKAANVLDQVIARFPDRAGEALLKKAEVLDALNSSTSAQEARQSLLNQYGASEAAAELRMKYAESAAAAGDLQTALRWAQETVKFSPDQEVTPEAGFWAGRWARQLGQSDVAQAAFEHVIGHYPESYYAWRSAVMLGWDVGDFKTVRSKLPEVQLPPQRSPLPTGSEALQELYLLGHNQTAWERWQVEFSNHQEATVAEQFTDGLMRLGVGDNLDGIYMVSSLSWRDHPEDQAQYQTLKDNPDYWQALYPFPFADLIQTWSLERQLNPLLVTALIRQESRFEPNIRSVVGAAGLMQVMPETAAWIQEQAGIPDYNLDNPNDNVNLGTWYLDYTHREYDNHSLFAVASYNAGPGAVADWISQGGFADADEFVKKIPYPETQGYVHSVFEGYWNYLRLYNPEVAKQVSQYQSRSARASAVSHSAVSH